MTLNYQIGCPECDCKVIDAVAWSMPIEADKPNLLQCTGCKYQGRPDEFMLAPESENK